MAEPYDAVLIVSFGGPEGPDDVLPFLENVLRGKNVPRERMLEVAEHYEQFGGVSPINAQNRALIAALVEQLNAHGPHLPVYWGNRNWHPLLPDALQQMADDGIRNALALFTSAYSSYSGCRQYREDIERARQEVGPEAPQVSKLRAFYNHPGFIEPMIESVHQALAEIPAPSRPATTILYTAHSIPTSMAEGCAYETQLRQACSLVSGGVGNTNWHLVYQSRSGPPTQPWLEPDVCDFLEELHRQGDVQDVVIVPIGFVSDHLEVLYDLDTEAQAVCEKLGINMLRAATVGTHPRFIQMIRELIEERLSENPDRPALGQLGPVPGICPEDCCPAPQRGRATS
jgi:ferrochelatase